MAILSFLLGSGAAAAPVKRFELPRIPLEGEQLILSHGGERLAIRKPPPFAASLWALPVAADILAEAAPRTFGAEERCALRAAASGLELHCAPGRAPAGLLLAFDARYPRGAPFAGSIEAEGDGGFLAQFGHAGEDADAAAPVLAGAPFPLPSGNPAAAAQVAVLAPPGGGVVRIAAVRLLPARRSRPEPLPASAWAWEPELWQEREEELLSAASRLGLRRLMVTLRVDGKRVADPAALARFVAAAGRRGIAVEAVEGDPAMVSPAGLAAAEARARAIAVYQRAAPPEARLAGVQYDIEPYALASWGRYPADYQGWSESVRGVARALGEPIHIVLPFWVAEEEDGRAFLEAIAPAVNGVTVMAYRTDPAAVTRIAEPLLAWSAAAGKPLRVALEAGPVAEEAEERFVSALRGRIAVARVGEKVVASLLGADEAVPGARMYASAGRAHTPPARISFLGAEARMMATAEALAEPLAAWPSFNGFAYHGLEWRR